MRVLTEAVQLDNEISLLEQVASRIELRACRLLAYLLVDSIPTGLYLQLQAAISDEGRPLLLCGPVMDGAGEVVVDNVYDLSAVGDIEWLATLMTEGGAWEQAARASDDVSSGAIWMDLQRALTIDLESEEE